MSTKRIILSIGIMVLLSLVFSSYKNKIEPTERNPNVSLDMRTFEHDDNNLISLVRDINNRVLEKGNMIRLNREKLLKEVDLTINSRVREKGDKISRFFDYPYCNPNTGETSYPTP